MTTRRWMIVVMVVGIGLAARMQIARWEEQREQYEVLAEVYGDTESHFRQFADRTRDEWLAACRDVDERNKRGGRYQLLYPPDPDEGRRTVEHFARLRKKYERGAAYPWLPLEPDRPFRSECGSRRSPGLGSRGGPRCNPRRGTRAAPAVPSGAGLPLVVDLPRVVSRLEL
jgi:hypothetical protein